MAHRGQECGFGTVRRFGAPLEDECQVMDLRIVEGKGASRRQLFGEPHVLGTVRNATVSADDGDRTKQPPAGDKRYGEEGADPELTQDAQVLRTVGRGGEHGLDVLGDGDGSGST